MSNIELSLQQWTVGTTPTPIKLFELRGATTFTNITVLTQDEYYRFYFSNTSNAVYLLSGQITTSTTGTLFVLKDSLSNQYNLNLVVTPPRYSVSSSVVTFLYDSITNLPIRFTAPTTTSGSLTIPLSYSGSLMSTAALTIPRSNAAQFTAFNFGPTLPVGLTSSIDGAGNVTIAGTPGQSRVTSVFNLYARTAKNQVAVTPITLQVALARFQFSNVTGYDSNFSAVIGYKTPVDVRFSCRPALTSINDIQVLNSPPSGLAFSLANGGSTVVLSGTTNDFLDTAAITKISVNNFYFTTPLTLTYSMNPSLELLYSPTAQTYSCNQFTIADPMFTIQGVAHPSSFPAPVLTLASGPPGLSMTSTGIFYGYFPSPILTPCNVVVNATMNGYSNSATFQLSVINEHITIVSTFGGNTLTPGQTIDVSENVQYFITNVGSTNVPRRSIRLYDANSADGYPGLLDIDNNTGLVTLEPHGISQITSFTFNICAYAEVANSNVQYTVRVHPDSASFQSTGLAVFSNAQSQFTAIQGRPIVASDYPGSNIVFTAVAVSKDRMYEYVFGPEFVNSGLTLDSNGLLGGTPTFAGSLSTTITAITVNNIRTTTPFFVNAIPDQLVIASPETTDFVIGLGNTKSVQLTAYPFSAVPIVSFGITGQPAGVFITPEGTLTFTGQAFLNASPFQITATLYNGSVVSNAASITVNDPLAGSFRSPVGSERLFIPNGTSFPVVTNPPNIPLSIAGSPNLSIVNFSIANNGTGLYPPVLASLTAAPNMTIPLRITDSFLQPYVVGGLNTNWIQYVPIVPITLSATRLNKPVIFAVPFPPRGLKWNPLTATLTGAPYDLTIQSSFVAYASDQDSVQPFVITYSSKTPAYLRTFSVPSSYTNYVKQRAFIHAAVHASDRTAFLPDPILTSETAPYPIDVCTAVLCGVCKVSNYIPAVVNTNGWAPFQVSDWDIEPTELTFVGTQNVPPYSFLRTANDYSEAYIKFNTMAPLGSNVQVGVGPINVNTAVAYGFQINSNATITMITQPGNPIQYISPTTLSYVLNEDAEVVYSGGIVYYMMQGKPVAQTTSPIVGSLAVAVLANATGDAVTNISYGYGSLDVTGGRNWYARDGRSWSIGSNFVTFIPSGLPLLTNTIVNTSNFTGNSYFKFVTETSISGLAGFTRTISATTLSYGFQMNSSTVFEFVGTNVVPYTASFQMSPGTELAVVLKGSNAYYLENGLVVGVGSNQPQTNYPMIKLLQAYGSLSNIAYGTGTAGYSFQYNYFNAPSTKWIRTISPYNAITHIASSTDTTYSFLSASNMFVTAQPTIANGQASFGLSNANGLVFRFAFNYPFAGQVSAFNNNTFMYSAPFSTRSYYAVSVSGGTLTFYRDGSPVQTAGSLTGVFQAFITTNGNGDSFSPVSVGTTFFDISTTGSGNWVIANDYIEKKQRIGLPDFANIYPPANSRLDFVYSTFTANSQVALTSTAIGEPLFDFNIFVRNGSTLIANRMLEDNSFQTVAAVPVIPGGNNVGLQVLGSNITIFFNDISVATFPTKFGRTGLTAPWRYYFYGQFEDTFVAKNLVLTPL